MKTFFKSLLVSILFFSLAYSLGSFYSLRNNHQDFYNHTNIEEGKKLKTKIIAREENQEEKKKVEEYKDLDTAISKSPRKNFLILGLEDIRTDTMILASFDRHAKILDLISIPRDTYIHRKGYDRGPQRKINAIYHVNGIEGVGQAVNYIVDLPIDNYFIIDFQGVKEVVDLVGGVEVDVPFHMKYKNIDIKEGRQLLNGDQALGFIRWRKNDDNKINYFDGDLGRIKAQHEFLKSLLSKSKNNAVEITRKAFDYVETDLGILQLIRLARDAKEIKDEDINFYTMPGQHEFRTINGLLNSYYIFDGGRAEELIENIYNVKKHP